MESIWLARRAGLAADKRAFVLTDSNINLGRLAKTASAGDSELIQDVRMAVMRCRNQGPLGLVWVPGHVGLEGNERADHSAGEGSKMSGARACAELRGGSNGLLFVTNELAAEITRTARKLAGLPEADDASDWTAGAAGTQSGGRR